MNETYINLFYRAPAEERAAIKLLTSKGPSVYVICAVSSSQVIYNTRRQGAFRSNATKAWLQEMLEMLPTGKQIDSVIIVGDNAPCRSKLEEDIT